MTIGLYPRLIEIHRSRGAASGGPTAGIGLSGYSGREETTTVVAGSDSETILFTGIPAAIDAQSPGRTRGQYIPADIIEKPQWRILIPASAVPQTLSRTVTSWWMMRATATASVRRGTLQQVMSCGASDSKSN